MGQPKFAKRLIVPTPTGTADAVTKAYADALISGLLSGSSGSDSVATNQTTTNTSYVDLATVGPAVTKTSVGTLALILWSAHGSNNTANKGYICSVAISGATTLAAADANGILWHEHATASLSDESMQFMVATINPGSNTYTMKYKVAGGSGTASFERRRIWVLAP